MLVTGLAVLMKLGRPRRLRACVVRVFVKAYHLGVHFALNLERHSRLTKSSWGYRRLLNTPDVTMLPVAPPNEKEGVGMNSTSSNSETKQK